MHENVFLKPKLNLFGHEIDQECISFLSGKVNAIQNFLQLTSVRQLRRFLGLMNYDRRFLPNCSNIFSLLTKMAASKKLNITLQVETVKVFS